MVSTLLAAVRLSKFSPSYLFLGFLLGPHGTEPDSVGDISSQTIDKQAAAYRHHIRVIKPTPAAFQSAAAADVKTPLNDIPAHIFNSQCVGVF